MTAVITLGARVQKYDRGLEELGGWASRNRVAWHTGK